MNENQFRIRILQLLTEALGINVENGGIAGINLKLDSQLKTPNLLRETGSGVIGVEIYSVSFANVGSADGVILGKTIKAGEVLTFSANGGINNKYDANTFTYDATGTELLIIYNS